jgi:hypothetical protein
MAGRLRGEPRKILPVGLRPAELSALERLQAALQERETHRHVSFTDAIRFAIVSSASAMPGDYVASATSTPQLDPELMGQSWPLIRPEKPKKP